MKSDPLTFSIVLPTYRRHLQLEACLLGLSRLDYPREAFEVIVVDDGSENSPEHIVQKFQQSLNVRLLRQKHSGPATARNTGSASANHRFVFFIDDDCVPLPDLLRNLSVRFQELPDQAVVGRIVNGLPENLYSRASQMLIDYLYSRYNPEQGPAHFFTTSNVAFPLEQFRKTGGFDPTFERAAGEDRDLCDRWMQLGYQLTYAPEVTILHQHNLNLSSFFRQQFNYGRGAYHFRNLKAVRNHQHLQFEPVSFYLNLIRYPLHQDEKSQFALSFLMFVSQAATAAGFLWGKCTNGKGRA